MPAQLRFKICNQILKQDPAFYRAIKLGFACEPQGKSRLEPPARNACTRYFEQPKNFLYKPFLELSFFFL